MLWRLVLTFNLHQGYAILDAVPSGPSRKSRRPDSINLELHDDVWSRLCQFCSHHHHHDPTIKDCSSLYWLAILRAQLLLPVCFSNSGLKNYRRQFMLRQPRAGSRIVRIDLLHFLAGCRTRRLYQVFCVSYLSMLYIVLLFIRAPFYVMLVFIAMHYVFSVLAKLSVLAKWFARKPPLRKPHRGKAIVFRNPRPKIAYDFLGLLYYFIVLLCV